MGLKCFSPVRVGWENVDGNDGDSVDDGEDGNDVDGGDDDNADYGVGDGRSAIIWKTDLVHNTQKHISCEQP